jgi:transcriptional regulator with XRE-family HTH domain
MPALTKEFFAARLKQSMELSNIDEAAVASRSGLHLTQVYHYTGGRRLPSVQSLRALAEALGENTDWLLGVEKKAWPRGVQPRPKG